MLLPLVAVVPMLVYPPDKRGTAMGMAGIVMAAGPAIGPVVGGLVIDSFGWRPMFIGIAVVALVILVGGTMMLKNVGELKNPKLNILSVVLSTIAFGGLLYGFSSASTMGWASPVVITSIVVGLVAFVAFVYKQVKLDEPLLRVDTLATRNFRNSAILVTLINAAVAATNVTLPIFIQNVLGQSATVTGMVMLPRRGGRHHPESGRRCRIRQIRPARRGYRRPCAHDHLSWSSRHHQHQDISAVCRRVLRIAGIRSGYRQHADQHLGRQRFAERHDRARKRHRQHRPPDRGSHCDLASGHRRNIHDRLAHVPGV